MKIDIIIPSNSVKRINQFLKSFSKMKEFKKYCTIHIIGNGELKQEFIEYNNTLSIRFVRFQREFDIIPFAELRGSGMLDSNCDYFLFLDDDHIFHPKADNILIECIEFLKLYQKTGVLQLEKDRENCNEFYNKQNAHIWTSRGLFIKNIDFNYKEIFKLEGACEDLVYGYATIEQGYLPYNRYNSGIERGCQLPNNYKELNDPSYNEKILDKNCIGYIRELYDDKDWQFYGNLANLEYPNDLKEMLK